MAFMIDTDILIDAVTSSLDSAADERCRAARHLVENAKTIAVSAVTLFEFQFGASAQVMAVIANWRLDVLVVDALVATRAAQILQQAHKQPTFCSRCLGIIPPEPCVTCGGQATKQRKTNDALIVATADVRPEIDILYAVDGGVLYLGQFAKNVQVEKPPTPPPEPLSLFPALAAVSKRRAK